MDKLIEGFIHLSFTDEMAALIFKAFRILNLFNYSDVEADYINLLMTEDTMLPEDMQDSFVHTLRTQLEEVLSTHLIRLVDHYVLHDIVEILAFLHLVQNLEDYKQISVTMDSSADKYVVFATMVHDHTGMDPHRVLSVVENIDDAFFKSLQEFIHNKVSSGDAQLPRYSPVGMHIIQNMRDFIVFTKRTDLLGAHLMDSGILLDQPIKRYKNFIGEFFDTIKDEDKAVHYLSLLYLTREGVMNPTAAYKDTVDLFFHDLSLISNLENQIAVLSTNFATYLKVKDEKDRLSKSSGKEQ